MVEQPTRKRRRFRRAVLAFVLLPDLVTSYVVGAIGFVYLDAIGVITIDGPMQDVLNFCYWPLGTYSSAGLPGADALNALVEWAREAGQQRSGRPS
jgi:hypothetical protein